MEMHQIRYFLAVCESLNFTRAAESCHVTQPALTRAVQKLEDELGGTLFSREPGHVQLTDLGRLMRPHLEQIASQRDAALTTAHSFLRLEDASMNLGVMCTIGPLRFAGFLSRFRHDNPGIEISVREGVPRQLTELLDKGEVAAAVMAQPESFPDHCRVQPLYRERFFVVFPTGHRCATLPVVRLKDLHDESYLSRVNCEFRDAIRSEREAQGVNIRYALRSERDDWILSLVAAGMGFCIMPEFSVMQPGVVARPITEPEIVREVSLATVAGRRFSPALQAFVRAIKSYRWPEPLPAGA
jgi:DNA-binding transcriptional LysR family regulator